MTELVESNVKNIRNISIKTSSNFNIINLDLHKKICKAIDNAADDDKVSAIVMTGINDAFFVGENFEEIKSFLSKNLNECLESLIILYTKILELNKPSLIAPLGLVTGIGVPFTQLFDRCIICNNTIFSMPELSNGISSIIGSKVLLKTIGYYYAKDILYSSKTILSNEAKDYKLANYVVNEEELYDTIYQEAFRLGKYPIKAFRNTKSTLVKELIIELKNIKATSQELHKQSLFSK